MIEPGLDYPPRTVLDIAAYDLADCVAGYSDWHADDPEPGPNRSPAYRWGWANARYDETKQEDGLSGLRYAYIQFRREVA